MDSQVLDPTNRSPFVRRLLLGAGITEEQIVLLERPYNHEHGELLRRANQNLPENLITKSVIVAPGLLESILAHDPSVVSNAFGRIPLMDPGTLDCFTQAVTSKISRGTPFSPKLEDESNIAEIAAGHNEAHFAGSALLFYSGLPVEGRYAFNAFNQLGVGLRERVEIIEQNNTLGFSLPNTLNIGHEEAARIMLSNHKVITGKETDKPLCLVLYSGEDPNGAFSGGRDVVNLSGEGLGNVPGYDTLFFILKDKTSLSTALQVTSSLGRKVKLLYLAGHGLKVGKINLPDSNLFVQDFWDQVAGYDLLAEEPHSVINSCHSADAPYSRVGSFASYGASKIPGLRTYGQEGTSADVLIKSRRDGNVSEVNFRGRGSVTKSFYVGKPTIN